MNIQKVVILLAGSLLWTTGCDAQEMGTITVPAGFKVDVYANDVENARQMALGDQGTLFVGSRRAGKLHAVVDDDGDQVADRVILLDDDLEMPSGLVFHEGDLIVGALNRILRYRNIEAQLDSPPEPEVISGKLPSETHHGWKYLRMGPDGLLYIPVGAPCNVCDNADFAEIRRMNLADGSMDVFAQGVRNSVGLAFHPDTDELWFTDNGRDWLGDDLPSCELNHAPRAGMHFGFPYCHQGDLADEEFGDQRSCDEFSPPAANLGAHVAPLGLTFYNGDMFPSTYRKQLFIAEHGSWNRSSKVGYVLKLVRFDEQGIVTGQETFASGWLQGEEAWGRPNDVLVMPDGSLLVSDDKSNRIYRISYNEGE